jgi:hypothetical protein
MPCWTLLQTMILLISNAKKSRIEIYMKLLFWLLSMMNFNREFWKDVCAQEGAFLVASLLALSPT